MQGGAKELERYTIGEYWARLNRELIVLFKSLGFDSTKIDFKTAVEEVFPKLKPQEQQKFTQAMVSLLCQDIGSNSASGSQQSDAHIDKVFFKYFLISMRMAYLGETIETLPFVSPWGPSQKSVGAELDQLPHLFDDSQLPHISTAQTFEFVKCYHDHIAIFADGKVYSENPVANKILKGHISRAAENVSELQRRLQVYEHKQSVNDGASSAGKNLTVEALEQASNMINPIFQQALLEQCPWLQAFESKIFPYLDEFCEANFYQPPEDDFIMLEPEKGASQWGLWSYLTSYWYSQANTLETSDVSSQTMFTAASSSVVDEDILVEHDSDVADKPVTFTSVAALLDRYERLKQRIEMIQERENVLHRFEMINISEPQDEESSSKTHSETIYMEMSPLIVNCGYVKNILSFMLQFYGALDKLLKSSASLDVFTQEYFALLQSTYEELSAYFESHGVAVKHEAFSKLTTLFGAIELPSVYKRRWCEHFQTEFQEPEHMLLLFQGPRNTPNVAAASSTLSADHDAQPTPRGLKRVVQFFKNL